MPRYLVERTFQEKVWLPEMDRDDRAGRAFARNNALDGVRWVRSYVAWAQRKSYCIYDAPSPEAIRQAAARNGLPVDRITEVGIVGLQRGEN